MSPSDSIKVVAVTAVFPGGVNTTVKFNRPEGGEIEFIHNEDAMHIHTTNADGDTVDYAVFTPPYYLECS